MMFPIIREKIDQFHPMDLVSISFGCLRPELKKLEMKRQALDLNIESMSQFSEKMARGTNLDSDQLDLYKKAYFQIAKVSKRHCYNNKTKEYQKSKVQNICLLFIEN